MPIGTRNGARTISYSEVGGDQAARVERISTLLVQGEGLPTPLQDAQFVEVKLGDGQLGPADYRTFILLVITPADVGEWQAVLTPLEQKPFYAEPGEPFAWWLDEAHFETLQFFAPDALTQRANGWVAIDVARGLIYIYTFTT